MLEVILWDVLNAKKLWSIQAKKLGFVDFVVSVDNFGGYTDEDQETFHKKMF